MSFTTPCYIHRNTIELRNKLRDLGYKVFPDIFNHPCLSAEDGLVIPADGNNRNRLYDCGTNTDLFLAIAALRDDSDYMQWFIEDITNPYGVGGQICGLEPRRKIGEKWICQTEKKSGESMRISNSIKEDIENSYNGTSNYRKATVSEITTHFKNKEQ